MQLLIKNLGPIKKGKIDLSKKFYVFVGYNNSGKTYLSQLLWSLFNPKTLESFANTAQFDELNFQGKQEVELTPELLDKILNQFLNFLTTHVIPKTFNIDSPHLNLEPFSIDFQYDISDFRNAHREGVVSLHINDNLGKFLIMSKVLGALTVTFEEKSLPTEYMKTLSKPLLPFNNNADNYESRKINNISEILTDQIFQLINNED